MSLWLTGRKMPPGYAEKMSKIKMGHKQSEESVEKRAKPYAFIDEDGNVYKGTNLKRFAQKMKCHRPNLLMVLSGKRKSHHGLKKYC